MNQELNPTCLKKDQSLITLRYINEVRRTNTTLDVLQESRKDDYWNVDANRILSDSWTGFTQFTKLNGNTPSGYTWSGERLKKFKEHQDPIIKGQRLGQGCQRQLNEEKHRSGLLKYRSSTMRES